MNSNAVHALVTTQQKDHILPLCTSTGE